MSTGVLGGVLGGVLVGVLAEVFAGFFLGVFYLGKGGWFRLGSALSCVGRASCYTFVSLTWYTVDREIFTIKKFSPMAWVAKIKRAKIFQR